MDSPDATYQSLVVNLLPDEFVLAQGVAGFSGDRVYWPLLHLLFYGTVQHEKRLAGALLEEKHTGSGQRKRNDDGGGQRGETHENIISGINANVSAGSIKKEQRSKTLTTVRRKGSEANDGGVNRRLTTTQRKRCAKHFAV